MKYPLDVQRYAGPPMLELDEDGRRLYFRACDLMARFGLNDLTMTEFDARNFEGVAILAHAERYLADRLAYELAKGKCKVEPDEVYTLSLSAR